MKGKIFVKGGILALSRFSFLFFVSFSANIFCQTNIYHPYPNDSAMWQYSYQTQSTNPVYYATEWLGDTVINSKTYKKVFGSSSTNMWTITANMGFSGAVRQDIPNEKIYSVNPSTGVETDISINQHLIVGDTFSTLTCPYRPLTIISIDSVQYLNKIYKRYNSQDSIGVGVESYVLGIGEESWGYPEGGFGLLCFAQGNVGWTYPSGSPFCQYLVSINDKEEIKNKFTLSPNPCTTQTTLQTNNLSRNATMTIYNSIGEEVKQIKNISGQEIIFHRDNLPSGLYFIRLNDGDKIFTDKLVITD